MKDWIKRKIEEIEALFPPERIRRSKERVERVWRGEKPLDRRPFTYGQCMLHYYDDVHTPEERLKASLEEIILHGKLNDDFIPSIFPGCKQGTIPSMFGAPQIVAGKDYSCERIIHVNEDIDRLPEPSLTEGTVAYAWLEMQKYFLEETGGRLPVHVTDMQGPVDVCGQLWGYDDLFIAAKCEPAYYHKLMGKATEAFVMFWKRQQEVLGANFMGTHLFGWSYAPPGAGASLSADSLVMVSPDFYDEFYRPYLSKIGETFGGASVHSCGDFSAVMGRLCATPCVKAIHAGQMSVEALVKAGIDTRKVILGRTNCVDVEKMFALAREHSLRLDLTVDDIWPNAVGDVTDPEKGPATWTGEDWDQMKAVEEKIMRQAARD